MSRLWDKGVPPDELLLRYTVGDDPELDARLVRHDARASLARARMLHEQGHLSSEDLEELERALEELVEEHARGAWRLSPGEEDVHTALENRLVERVGEAGRRIHLGRSRNDQVLAALRLHLDEAVSELRALGDAVVAALGEIEERQGGIPLPGYTHQQRAMPSSVALWAGGFRAEVEDDLEGLEAARRRILKNPLGSAAGYGVPGLALDRRRTTELLGFRETQEPVTAVQLSRGKAEAQVLFELCLLMQDLGRLAADLCLFATQEFGFVRLPERFTTGSSIMPQKRNPDVFELVRARAAQLPSELLSVLALTAKAPSGYHRDLQLAKAPLFRGLDTTASTLRVLARALPGVRFVEERTRGAMDPSLHAAEEAHRLARDRGLPFRDAYQEVARRLREDGPARP